jgi:hypothetical protein
MITAPAGQRDFALAAPRNSIAGFALVAAAVVLLDVTLVTLDRDTTAVVWGGLALAAYAGGLLFLISAEQRSDLGLARWKIGPWTLLWYSVVFGISTVTWSGPQTGIDSEIALSSVLRALWLVAAGVSAWMLGYRTGAGQLVRRAADRAMSALRRRLAAEVRSPAAPWLLYALGIAARLATVATTGRLGYVGNVSSAVTTATGYAGLLSALSLCAPLAVAAAALQVFGEGLRSARVTLAVLFLFELAFGAAAGNKQGFVIAVLAVVIPFSSARRKLPKVALAAVAILFLLIVIPFNQAYRDAARQGSVTLTPRQAIAAAPGILKQTVAGHNLLSVLPGSVDYLAQRVRDIDNVAIIVQRTPEQIKFRSPVQLIEGPAAGIIPRALWPGKPITVTGYQFSQQFYELPATLYTSSADTVIGGLYWYGGWVPLIAGMFVLGCGVRLFDDVVDVRTDTHAVFLVMLMFPSLVRGEYDWQSIIAGTPENLVVWLLALCVTFGWRRRA